MLKRIISLLITLTFISNFTFVYGANSSLQTEQIKKYLASPQGQQFLKSQDGRALAAQYGGVEEIEKGYQIVTAEVKETVEPLSEIELALSSDLLLQGKQPLRQYGYNLFKSSADNFTPDKDSQVNSDYIVGPGDSFNITLWGITEGIFKVDVKKDGTITLPKVGVVDVTGLTFAQLKPYIEKQLRRYYESVNVAITIDKLRTIKVYVVGEVNQPGSYSISSLSTLYTALFSAGGPSKKGSLRDIRLIRNGKLVGRADLYQFLLKGDKSQDKALKAGDTIFVPVIGPTVAVAGSVYRPGIYEIYGKADLKDLLYLAGGLLPSSYLSRIQVKRTLAHQKNIIRDENVTAKRAQRKFGLAVQNMDFVEVFSIYEKADNKVYLDGAVKYPGTYEFKAGMTIKDVLPNQSAFVFNAYLPHIEVIRTDMKTRKIKIFSIDYQKLMMGDKSQDIELHNMDQINVSSEKVKQGKITLSGEVARPGVYSFVPGEKLSSALKRAGGFTKDAYLFGAKFTRKSVEKIQSKRTEQLISNLEEEILRQNSKIAANSLGDNEQKAAEAQLKQSKQILELAKQKSVEGRIIVNLDYDLDKFQDSKSDLILEDEDQLFIPSISNVIFVLGEVYNSNSVIYSQDSSTQDYLDQVGGVTKNADKSAIYVIRADGSVISREQGYNVLGSRLMPGDTIVVPQTIEKFNFWAMFKDWTHWFYEAALAVAVLTTALK